MNIKNKFITIFILLSFSLILAEKYKFNNPIDSYKALSIDYFQMRHIKSIIMFICWPITDRVHIIKMFSENNICTSFPTGNHKKSHRDLDDLFRIQTTMIGVLFDSCCYDNGAPFFQKYTYFNASYVWLVLDCGHFLRSLDYLKTLPLLITTDLVITETKNNSKHLNLYDVYNTGFGRGGDFNFTHIGKWSPCKECNNDWKKYFLHSKVTRRYDLNGLTIKVVVLIEDYDDNPDIHSYLMDEKDVYTDALFKMNYRLILILKTMYNFTITFVVANNWSDKNSKGLYQSENLLGILSNKKADIMAAGLQIAEDRIDIADMLYFTYPFRCGFIFRYQGDFGVLKTSFLVPFEKEVWIAFIIVTGIVILIIWCILLFENKFLFDINKTLWSFSDTILSIIGACCQMGSEVNPITSASRLAYFIFFFTSLVMYNFYTSSIVSSLLNYRLQTFDIYQLADSPLECGAVDVGYAHYLLFDVPEKHPMNYFNSRKKTEDFFLSPAEGVKYVLEGGFAYHSEYNTIYNLIETTFGPTEICELQEIDTIPLSMMAIFAEKNSPYTEMFKVGLSKADETGHLKKLQSKWVARKPLCQAAKTFTEVSIHQITPVHVLLYVGFGLSFLLLLIEKRRWQDHIRKQTASKTVTKNREGTYKIH